MFSADVKLDAEFDANIHDACIEKQVRRITQLIIIEISFTP